VLRICIPVHNEATTIGVLLWRLRTVFQGFSREYDVVVYDDASTDGTADVLEPYKAVMPVTVLRGSAHRGYAASIDALVRHVAADDEYARRDALILMQGDFTESPEHLPELVKRFEGGADLVAVHRATTAATPQDERRLRRWGRWAVRPFLRMPPVADPFTGFRLVRIAVLRDLLRALGPKPVCSGDGWAANIDFALNVAPFARRIENVEFAPRYDVRQRPSRRRGWPDVIALFHWARGARSTVRPVPGAKSSESQQRAAGMPLIAATPIGVESVPLVPSERMRGPRVSREENERNSRNPRRGESRPGREKQAPAPDSSTSLAPDALASSDEPNGRRSNGRPSRPERPAREPRESRPARTNSTEPAVVAADLEATLRSAVAPPTDGEPSIASADVGANETSAESAERKRRRRRRSRRGRGERGESEGREAGGESDSDDTNEARAPRAAEPERAAAVDRPDAGAGDAGAEPRRKSRRRRRGRRPGGAAGGATGEMGGSDAGSAGSDAGED
jgi:hypothetical protein